MKYREEVVEYHYQLGLRLRKLRKHNKLTQQKLADMVGLDRTYISRIERGICNPSLDNLILISHGLGISPSFLLYGIANPPNRPYNLHVVAASEQQKNPKYHVTKI